MPARGRNIKRRSIYKSVADGVIHYEDPYVIFSNKTTARGDWSSVSMILSKIRKKTNKDLRREPRVPTLYTVMFGTPKKSTRADATKR